MAKKIVVTGANGFLGSAAATDLANRGHDVLGLCRHPVSADFETAKISALDESVAPLLADADVIIHCAARVHVMRDQSADPLEAFREVNVTATLNLARMAAEAGIRRFVFISSVKVNGEHTPHGSAFSEADTEAPEDPYGQSKLEAEKGLRAIAKETSMEVVIIRPPLVYGPGVKGNFLNLLKLANTVLPLPFGAIDNRRSMVYLGNLVDFIGAVTESPAAANETFLITDGEDVSTTDLLRGLRKAAGRSPRLLPVPEWVFHFLGRITGKSAVVDRLCGSLRIDSRKARETVGWAPPYSVDQGLSATVSHFLDQSNPTLDKV